VADLDDDFVRAQDFSEVAKPRSLNLKDNFPALPLAI
jgi:hypothetical protein